MTDPPLPSHPESFRALCQEAINAFQALVPGSLEERTRLVPRIRALLEAIHQQAADLDLRAPGYAAEQGLLVDAASALQSIDLDRGGPRVAHWVERAVADLRRVQGA